MSARDRQLAMRRESLRLRSAAQRAELVRTVAHVQHRLQSVDRGLLALKSMGRKPLVIGAAAAVLAFVGPKRIFSLATRSAMAVGVARKLLGRIR